MSQVKKTKKVARQVAEEYRHKLGRFKKNRTLSSPVVKIRTARCKKCGSFAHVEDKRKFYGAAVLSFCPLD